jgi:hypothetical protein
MLSWYHVLPPFYFSRVGLVPAPLLLRLPPLAAHRHTRRRGHPLQLHLRTVTSSEEPSP